MTDQQIPELRERRTSEILDASIKIWTHNLRKLIPFAAAILVPFQLISAYLLVAVKPTLTDTLAQWQKDIQAATDAGSTEIPSPEFTSGQIGAFTAAIIISVVSTFALSAALTAIIGKLVLREDIDNKSAIRTAVRVAPKLFAATLLGILVSGGATAIVVIVALVSKVPAFFVLLLPTSIASIWLAIRFTMAGPALVLERLGPVKALRRSLTLTKGRWWPVLGVTIVSALVTGIPSSIVNSLINAILKGLGGNNAGFEFVWAALSGTVSAALFAPLSAAISVFLYFDLRVRKEGFDLQRLAADFSMS